jgi:hypothetical protein
MEPHNIGTHLKGIETSVQVVPLLLLKYFHFWASISLFEIISKYLQSLKGELPPLAENYLPVYIQVPQESYTQVP